VEHGGEGDDGGVFHLAEVAFDLGLGAVVGDDLGGGSDVGVLVGEEDAFAEQLVFEGGSGGWFGAPSEAQLFFPGDIRNEELTTDGSCPPVEEQR
jgi:hypothetical protein